jgi:energy-converting hydrogenase Eha subunit A
MEGFYIAAFLAVSVGSVIASLLILIRAIPRLAHRHKWRTSFLWLFATGLGTLGVAIVFEILGYPSGILLFLIADTALVLGAFGLGAIWELQEFKKMKWKEGKKR